MSESGGFTPSARGAIFWERFSRLTGIWFIGFFIVAIYLYGAQPEMGASADTLNTFYNAGRRHVLIASMLNGMAVLSLLWFAAAIRATLADAGLDGWGTAVALAAAVLGAMLLLLVTISAALANSIAAAGDPALTSALNDSAWAVTVLTSFPRAMLIVAGTFGLWRAGLVSTLVLVAGIAAAAAALLGAITWKSSGLWAPDGVYTRFVSPAAGCIWIVIVSWVLLVRGKETRAAW